MNTPTLETKRLILRKFTENDLKAIYGIYSDEEETIFLLDMSTPVQKMVMISDMDYAKNFGIKELSQKLVKLLLSN